MDDITPQLTHFLAIFSEAHASKAHLLLYVEDRRVNPSNDVQETEQERWLSS